MSSELKRRKRWLQALKIAKCLFEDEGYHTEYLEDLEGFLKGDEKGYSGRMPLKTDGQGEGRNPEDPVLGRRRSHK